MHQLHRAFQHHAFAQRVTHKLVALIQSLMSEPDYAPIRLGLRLSLVDDAGLYSQRVADKNRVGKFNFLHAKIAQRRPQSRVADRQTNDQGQGEIAVNDNLLKVLR